MSRNNIAVLVPLVLLVLLLLLRSAGAQPGYDPGGSDPSESYVRGDGTVAGALTLGGDIDMAGNQVSDSTAALNLGTAAATGHALVTGDVLVGGGLEIDGVTYADGTLFAVGTLQLSAASSAYWTNNVYLKTTLAPESATDGTLSIEAHDKQSRTHIAQKRESVTFANDASKATVGSIKPDGAMIMGVSGRVTTALAGCTSVDVGIGGGDTDLYADNVAIAAGTTFAPSGATADWREAMLAAGEITVTAVGGNCTSGVVAITVHFLSVTAQASN